MRVLPGFHQVLQGLRDGLGWFEVRFHERSTRVPPGSARAVGGPGWFHESSTRVLQGLRGGWFEVRLPPGSARATGWSGVVWGNVPRRFHQGSTRVTRFCEGCGVVWGG